MPSGCYLRRVAQPPANQLAVPDRPSASDYPEVEESIDPEDMRMAVTAPAFQPYRGETGRAWMAKEYGISMDNSSIMSSETEREDTDDEVCSFDLGPEPYDPSGQERIPSDEWLDDHQQGLQPGSSEPKPDPYDRYLAMPIQPSILDMIRSDVEKNEQDQPPPPERALTPTIRWDFDYTRDEPPVVQRLAETPRHSTPRPDPNTPSARPRPAVELPRPWASSAPPSANPAKRMALRYHPVTEEVTPPITPPHAQAIEENIHLSRNMEGVGAVAHGAPNRKLPLEWARAAGPDWPKSRSSKLRRHRLPTLNGLQLLIRRRIYRDSQES